MKTDKIGRSLYFTSKVKTETFRFQLLMEKVRFLVYFIARTDQIKEQRDIEFKDEPAVNLKTVDSDSYSDEDEHKKSSPTLKLEKNALKVNVKQVPAKSQKSGGGNNSMMLNNPMERRNKYLREDNVPTDED